MATIAETERFLIDDEGDGWLSIARKGGDSMSVRARDLPELIESLQRGPAGRSDGATPCP